jgi:transcriptional regulator with XRE-family HTH domain
VKTVAAIESALLEFFAGIDEERFDTMDERLHATVELADELTGEWLRGKERVSGYLRAQMGIVTDIASRISSISSRWITEDAGLATFVATMRYSLDGVPREEALTGTTIFTFETGEPLLLLLHLGAPAVAREPGGEIAELRGAAAAPASALGPVTMGQALRRQRLKVNLSLRGLAAETHLSPSFLSQVERGLTAPSLGSLRRISEALGLRLSAVLGDGPPGGASADIVRARARRNVLVPGTGVDIELLATERAGIEAMIVRLEPGAAAGEALRTEVVDQFVLVLEGTMRLTWEGEEIELVCGDAASIPAGVRHRIAPADTVLRCLVALSRQS